VVDRITVKTGDGGIAHEHDAAPYAALGQLRSHRRESSRPDQDRVGAGAEVDGDLDHGWA
jgi:hypothetical protein